MTLNNQYLFNILTTGKWKVNKEWYKSTLTGLLNGEQMTKAFDSMPSTQNQDEDEDEEMPEDVAFYSINGILVRNINLPPLIASYDDIIKESIRLKNDPTVKKVGFYIKSPGGNSIGLQETCEALDDLSQEKETFIYADYMNCSAGYELALHCHYFYAAPSAITVNVGCIMEHIDASEMYKMKGMNITTIASGQFKALEGTDNHTLTPDEHKMLFEYVDSEAQEFRDLAMKKYGVDNTHLQGLAYPGKIALQHGLLDGCISTYSEFKKFIANKG